MNRLAALGMIVLTFFVRFSLGAQPTAVRALPDPIPGPVIPWDLTFPSGDSAFSTFFEKLDRLVFEGNEEINIVHMGGSHVQAGLLTDALRYHLQQIGPGLNGERGFFFPFTLAHTNNPYSYKVWTNVPDGWHGERCSVPTHEGPWGVSGIRAWTKEKSAAVKIYSTEEPFKYTHVRVFAAPSDSSFGVAFKYQPDSVWYNSEIQACEALYTMPQDTVSFQLYKSDTAQTYFSLEGVQVMNKPYGLRYHALGTNGAATQSFLKCERFEEQLHAMSPDMVIFGLGINDAYLPKGEFDSVKFEENYSELMAQIHRVNPNAVFVFLTNNDSYYKGRHNPHGEIVVRSMRRLAREHNAAVHDFYHMMGGAKSMSYWIKKGWAARDGIHMTRTGYAIQADWLAHSITDWFVKRYARPFTPQSPTPDVP